MDIVKRKVNSTNDIYIERFRGYVIIEGKDDKQVHELVCNFNEISLRPIKGIDSEELGFMIYGRNIAGPQAENLIKEILKCSRTQLNKKKMLRTRETITNEEIEMLKDKYVCTLLPEGWFYNGFMYFNYDGV
jgi:hypothetical protein